MVVHVSASIQYYLPLSEPAFNKTVCVALPIFSALAFGCAAFTFSASPFVLCLGAAVLTTSLLISAFVKFPFEKVAPPKKELTPEEAQAFLNERGIRLFSEFGYLENYEIDEETVAALDTLLSSKPQFKEFSVDHSNIVRGNERRFAQVLQKCNGLTTLTLSSMTLDAKAFFTQEFDFWKILTRLSLFSLPLEEEGTQALAALLPKMENLIKLDLRLIQGSKTAKNTLRDVVDEINKNRILNGNTHTLNLEI